MILSTGIMNRCFYYIKILQHYELPPIFTAIIIEMSAKKLTFLPHSIIPRSIDSLKRPMAPITRGSRYASEAAIEVKNLEAEASVLLDGNDEGITSTLFKIRNDASQ